MDGAGSPAWKVFWERGMELFWLSKYVDSLVQFDKAASRNSSEQLTFESRAMALEKLRRYEEALRDCQRVLDLAPASYEGYARSSQILFKTRKFPAALGMTNLALEHVNECDQEQQDELLCLKTQILHSLWQTEAQITSASHFGKLPFEIACIIFILAVGESVSAAFKISLVCKIWRATTLETPALWKSVVVKRRFEVQRARVVFKRGNGIIKRLEIHSEFGFHQKTFFDENAHDSFWAQLETLVLTYVAKSPRPRHFIPWEKLQLTNFVLHCTPHYHSNHMGDGFWEALNRMTFHTIRSVTFTTGPSVVSSHFERYTNLTKLQIGSKDFGIQCSHRILTSLFVNNLGLETVVIGVYVTGLSEIGRPSSKAPFAMASLVHLEIFGYGSWLINSWKGIFSFPALQTFHLYEGYLGDQVFYLKPLAANLVALKLSNTMPVVQTPPSTITSLLQAARNLVTLVLLGFTINLTDEMDALAGRNQSIICSKLEHVHFESCNLLSSVSLVSLVEGRLLHARREVIDSDGMYGGAKVIPIQTLVIEQCDLIDPDTIRRLRSMVKRIQYVPSHSFTTKVTQTPQRRAWR
ncbi:hypothetical protein BD410DRAFT_898554 [Rickenella mellea]|uniref:Uncharacterized protein n=1 Tax=Rickenella mellea TaxID=50990 RepID=A0A4Y7Q2T7_9AGAM|nr:hypothetical protein BD410DRAFT_898554 [Rickenella mellea]